MLKLTQLIGFGGGGAYRANAVDYDGSNDYLSRSAALAGAPNSGTGIVSYRLRLDAVVPGGAMAIFYARGSSSVFELYKDGTHRLGIQVISALNQFQFRTAATFSASATWIHFLASYDLNYAPGSRPYHLYISDVSDAVIDLDNGAAATLDWAALTSGHDVAARNTGSNLLNGALSDLYVAPGHYLDFSIQANRRKFITAEGKPADLGGDGSAPTGVAPLVYLPNPAASVNVNAGTGGDFVINGSPTDASTSPSD